LPSAAEALVNDEAAFEIHGHELGLSETFDSHIRDDELMSESQCIVAARTLYPPTKMCINPECSAWQLGTPLKKEEQRCVIIFMHASSAHPAWSVHLKCRGMCAFVPA